MKFVDFDQVLAVFISSVGVSFYELIIFITILNNLLLLLFCCCCFGEGIPVSPTPSPPLPIPLYETLCTYFSLLDHTDKIQCFSVLNSIIWS